MYTVHHYCMYCIKKTSGTAVIITIIRQRAQSTLQPISLLLLPFELHSNRSIRVAEQQLARFLCLQKPIRLPRCRRSNSIRDISRLSAAAALFHVLLVCVIFRRNASAGHYYNKSSTNPYFKLSSIKKKKDSRKRISYDDRDIR